MLYKNIDALIQYGLRTQLLDACEVFYARNLLLDLFHETNYESSCCNEDLALQDILDALLEEAVQRNIIEDSIVYKDLFDTKLMNCIMPRPATIQAKFNHLYEKDPIAATNYYYDLSKKSDYIRTSRVKKDMKWVAHTNYGDIDISINLSKPEKDPKAIAAAKNAVSTNYPACLLCAENEGYAGHVTHPGRVNHRIIPIIMHNSEWGLQYSPYVYYNEHCIVFSKQHQPMKIEQATFEKLIDFTKLFPHYFLGSNADLPIVGGSILSHDHYQGGNYTFAMQSADIEQSFNIPSFEDVEAGIVKWPMSVIRIRCKDDKRLVACATHILDSWRMYSDNDADIIAFTNTTPHNTITPIARRVNDDYELDLVLRNNRTSEQYPDGIFHPHAQYHNIKKENIGLIEVMGLAILPARLKTELQLIADCLVNNSDYTYISELDKHKDWIESIKQKYTTFHADTIQSILEEEVGIVFTHVLENAGVYKCDEKGRQAFKKFIHTL